MDQDLEEILPAGQFLSLDESIMKSKKCVDLMVDNRYMDAIELSSRMAQCSLYHSHCHSMLLFFKVYLSLELPEVKKAQEASEQTLSLCEEIRTLTLRDNFLVKLFFDHDYNQFSDEELHAELIRAEQTIFATLTEFFCDQSIFVLMKVSYRLRSAYMTYKSFLKILDTKQWSSEISASTFNTGVKLGLGIYNLMFSMVPERLMNILSMVGFKGSKYEGLDLLREAGAANDIRSFVAQMTLSLYECYLDQMWNVHTVKTANTEKYIKHGLSTNSLSIWYSIFKGRISLIDHDLEKAIEDFEGCVRLKNLDIRQLTTLYHWELMWCYALLGDWKKAIKYSHDLRNMCVWSQSTLCYLEASFRCMYLEVKLMDENNNNNNNENQQLKQLTKTKQQNEIKVPKRTKNKNKKQVTAPAIEMSSSSTDSNVDVEDDEHLDDCTIEDLKDKIHELMIQVPEKVKRYAGRRIPMEKFACEKVIKYNEEGRLICPAYELFITWNHLIFIEGKEQFLLPIIQHVDKCLKKFSKDLNDESYFLLMLVKGACYRLLERLEEAKTCLLEVVKNKKVIKHDRHLYSFACLELGIVLCAMDLFDECQQWLLEARHSIKKEDPMELFVQFRVGKALRLMRKRKESIQPSNNNNNNMDLINNNNTNGHLYLNGVDTNDNAQIVQTN